MYSQPICCLISGILHQGNFCIMSITKKGVMKTGMLTVRMLASTSTFLIRKFFVRFVIGMYSVIFYTYVWKDYSVKISLFNYIRHIYLL